MHFRFEETLQLKIEIEGVDLEYHGVASVRHIRAAEDQKETDGDEEYWITGCAIAPPLSDETFAFLATTAGKERRRSRRLPIAAKATVRRQTESTGTAATLHNLSSGGFCFRSDVQFDIGESVQMSIEAIDGSPRVVPARVCWQVETPEGSIAGCQFASRRSYADVCACLTEQPATEPPLHFGDAPTSKLVLTAAVLAMFVPPMLTLALQTSRVSAESSPAAVAEQKQETAPASPSELAAPAPTIVASIAAGPQFRAWLDNTGKHSTEAKLVRTTETHVVLEKPNGKFAKVPWRRLSEADQKFARESQGE